MSTKRKRANADEKESGFLLREFRPKTKGQAAYVRAIVESDITICSGPAGSGKTACAVGIAAEHLVNGKVKKIVITRPIVETGKSMGFLPGTFEEKIHPYLRPILDELKVYFNSQVNKLIQDGVIEISPLAYMRGVNLHESFIILDEAQNSEKSEIKMFLTRIGTNSRIVISGDLSQSDLRTDVNGLGECMDKLQDLDGVSIVKLTQDDIVRNPIIGRILARLD